MQAMADFRGLFMDVYIGWPGKVHDAGIFVHSYLYHVGMEGTLFTVEKKYLWNSGVFYVYTPTI